MFEAVALSSDEANALIARGFSPLDDENASFMRRDLLLAGNMLVHAKTILEALNSAPSPSRVIVCNSVHVYREVDNESLCEWSKTRKFASVESALNWLGSFQAPPACPSTSEVSEHA